MSRTKSPTLPPALAEVLDGDDLVNKVGVTILLVTMSEGGWPHFAMLSVGELLAIDPERIMLALWQGTESGSNLRRDRKASLATVLDGAGFYVEITAEDDDVIDVDGSQLDRFDCDVNNVLVDEVDYAVLTSGITFELPDETSVMARWRSTVDAIRGS